MRKFERNIALITGANGGMGRTISRRLGATMDLILTDVAQAPLVDFANTLKSEGYTVLGAMAGDLASEDLLGQLEAFIRAGDGLDVLVHAAGLSPAQADWKTILKVNILATQRLLTMVGPLMNKGATGVLIASMAGHNDLGMPELAAILDKPLDESAIDEVGASLVRFGKTPEEIELVASQIAYSLSKAAVIRLTEKKASEWGARGNRIVSISPGLIQTPMGLKEAESSPMVKASIDAQPLARWGTATDIALTVEFLVGPNAAFITGCDLRVDGGATALSRNPAAKL